MLKVIIAPILLGFFSGVFLLACVGEKNFQSKVLYAVMAIGLLVLLLISTRL